ncbi:hypothetical protein HDU93_009345 [Gonapodya sp. JEL0774]|nr:hypothetical protein HDU93_009345 [Gonapodya sp. JEL0774]
MAKDAKSDTATATKRPPTELPLPGSLSKLTSLIDDQGKPVSKKDVLSLGLRLVGLYFSAEWCPPCRAFSPSLSDFLKEHKDEFSIVYVSSDNNKEQMMGNIKGKGYWAVPYEDSTLRTSLSRDHSIIGIPTLVIVDGTTGEVISNRGKAAIQQDKNKAWEEWKQGTCSVEKGDGMRLGGIMDAVVGIVMQVVQWGVIYWILKQIFPKSFENDKTFEILYNTFVAPFTGARIETPAPVAVASGSGTGSATRSNQIIRPSLFLPPRAPMPLLSTPITFLSNIYSTTASFWTSLSNSALEKLSAHVGPTLAAYIVHVGAVQTVYHFLSLRYIDKHRLLQKYKIRPNEWEDPAKFDEVWAGVASWSNPWNLFRNQTWAYFLFFSGRESITATPSFGRLLQNLALGYLINDAGHYVWHRSMHTIPNLYKTVHKVHHEFRVTNVGAAQWDHWIETTGLIVHSSLGAILTGMTLFDYLFYFPFIFVYTDMHIHCGYRFPYNPLNLVNPPEFHDWHHYANIGNYGMGTPFWDWVFGTDRWYRESSRKRKGGKGTDGEPEVDGTEKAGFVVAASG